MRAQARPSAPNGFLVLSLLAVGTLLIGPSRAWAVGNVTFNQMTAERCAESGPCEWRLSCGVGENPQETQLLLNATARTKYSVKINRSLPIDRFPVRIHCTAWEDDGWFGETWEKLGTSSVEVPFGGDYRLDIANREQGTVRVQMSVDSLEIGIAPPPPPAAAPAGRSGARKAAPKPAPQPQFLGVFNPIREGHVVVVGLEWKPFKARMDELAEQGIPIERIEIFEHGGKRLWSGIFRSSSDQVQVLVDQDGPKFVDSWKKLTGGRMRTTDLEIYESGGKNLYAGIFRDLGEVHALWLGMTRKDFEQKVKELADFKGERVLDFEVYRNAGALAYDGAFRAGPRETRLWTGLDLAALQSRLQGLRGKEWEVVDVATYKDGTKGRFYDAVIRAGGTPGELVMAPDLATFARRWRELAAKGQRLVSLEIYRE